MPSFECSSGIQVLKFFINVSAAQPSVAVIETLKELLGQWGGQVVQFISLSWIVVVTMIRANCTVLSAIFLSWHWGLRSLLLFARILSSMDQVEAVTLVLIYFSKFWLWSWYGEILVLSWPRFWRSKFIAFLGSNVAGLLGGRLWHEVTACVLVRLLRKETWTQIIVETTCFSSEFCVSSIVNHN